MTATQTVPQDDVQQLERLVGAVKRLRTQVAQRIVGQEDVVDGILTAVLAGGHALLIGVPGLAKTLMVQTVAEALELSFNRVQFTPDLMPSDITGTEIIEEDLTTGRRVVPVRARAHLRQRGARRRDQPHPAEDPGRAAPGDAGAPGHRGRDHLPAARPLLRARHPEPDRAGGHLPAARGPARPVHAGAAGGLSQPGGGGGDRRADHRRRRVRRSTRCSTRRRCWRCSPWSGGSRSRAG